MELHRLHDTRVSKNFEKILLSPRRNELISVIEKLTKTKIIVKDNNVIIIW